MEKRGHIIYLKYKFSFSCREDDQVVLYISAQGFGNRHSMQMISVDLDRKQKKRKKKKGFLSVVGEYWLSSSSLSKTKTAFMGDPCKALFSTAHLHTKQE